MNMSSLTPDQAVRLAIGEILTNKIRSVDDGHDLRANSEEVAKAILYISEAIINGAVEEKTT